jgi:hypothetical protein
MSLVVIKQVTGGDHGRHNTGGDHGRHITGGDHTSLVVTTGGDHTSLVVIKHHWW